MVSLMLLTLVADVAKAEETAVGSVQSAVVSDLVPVLRDLAGSQHRKQSGISIGSTVISGGYYSVLDSPGVMVCEQVCGTVKEGKFKITKLYISIARYCTFHTQIHRQL